YALYPHMTVEQNLAFGLKLRKLPKQEINQRVQRVAKILKIEEFLKRKPRALSGGQRQRVAMGRAIVREPQAFLMDEPLSNLDAKLRVEMRAEIARLQRDLAVTTIYVTHDQTEAMTLGDRGAATRDGVLQQLAPPSSGRTSGRRSGTTQWRPQRRRRGGKAISGSRGSAIRAQPARASRSSSSSIRPDFASSIRRRATASIPIATARQPDQPRAA